MATVAISQKKQHP